MNMKSHTQIFKNGQGRGQGFSDLNIDIFREISLQQMLTKKYLAGINFAKIYKIPKVSDLKVTTSNKK